MSYILDSLKKSEQKRQKNDVPDIHTTHAAEDLPRRHLWPYLLLLALVVNASLLFWWFGPWPGSSPESQSVVVAEQQPITPSPIQPVQKAEVPSTTVPVSAEELTPIAVIPQVEKQPIVDTRTDTSVGRGTQKQPSNSEAQVQPPEAPVPSVVQQKPASVAVVVEKLGPQPTLSAAPVRDAGSDAAPSMTQRLYRPSELPPRVAAQLPPMLNMTLHYYSRLAKTRMVRINGRNLRQGAELKSDVYVDEITPHGVILKASGYRVWVEKP